MRRGVLLLLAGVTAAVVVLAPVAPAASESASGASSASPAGAVQRTSTTLAVATTVPTTVAETVPETAAVTAAPAAASTTVAAADSTTRDDPAATRLRRITYALVGLGGLILVLNLVFWKVTRPALLLPARSGATGKVSSTSDPAPAVAGTPAPTAPDLGTVADGAPAKISASAFLATPPGAGVPGLALPLAGGLAAAAPAVAVPVPVVPTAAVVPSDDVPPPEGAPAIDAPAPLDDIPLGAPKPLVGTDSAWIIEPESGSGLIPDPPTAVDFPEASIATTPVVEPIDVSSSEPGRTNSDVDAAPEAQPDSAIEGAPAPSYSSATQALISALSAIPDKEPTVVRFDDPPVERVARRDVVAEAAPEAVAAAPVAKAGPRGAPGFDRIAKEATATTPAVPERQVDDMALMASALSSLPPRRPSEVDDPDLPPVGEFYDQDLDPDDRPGRD